VDFLEAELGWRRDEDREFGRILALLVRSLAISHDYFEDGPLGLRPGYRLLQARIAGLLERILDERPHLRPCVHSRLLHFCDGLGEVLPVQRSLGRGSCETIVLFRRKLSRLQIGLTIVDIGLTERWFRVDELRISHVRRALQWVLMAWQLCDDVGDASLDISAGQSSSFLKAAGFPGAALTSDPRDSVPSELAQRWLDAAFRALGRTVEQEVAGSILRGYVQATREELAVRCRQVLDGSSRIPLASLESCGPEVIQPTEFTIQVSPSPSPSFII